MDHDILYTDFRDDEAYYALQVLREKGIGTMDLELLRENLRGKIVTPSDCEYGSLRFGVNKTYNKFPVMIVMCETEHDVIAAFRFAIKNDLHVSVRSGAHSFTGTSINNSGVVIDLSRMTRTKIKDDRVCVQAGVLLGPLTDELFKHRRIVPLGGCVNNGLGYFLYGGISAFTRFYGTGSDNIIDVKVLLANGSVVHANKNENEDLFWAMRGGGCGNYGIVLNMTLRTHPVDKVFTYTIIYNSDLIEEVGKLWFRFIRNMKLTSAFRGQYDVCIVSGYYLGDSRSKLIKYLQPLLELQCRLKIKKQNYVDAVRRNSGTGRWEPFYDNRNGFVKRKVGKDGLTVLADYVRGCRPYTVSSADDKYEMDAIEQCSSRTYFIFDALGGRNDEIPRNATAFCHRGYAAWFHVITQSKTQVGSYENTARLAKFYEQFKYNLSYAVYQNLPWLTLDNYLCRYFGENLERLRQIKCKYDPDNVFHYAQSITPY